MQWKVTTYVQKQLVTIAQIWEAKTQCNETAGRDLQNEAKLKKSLIWTLSEEMKLFGISMMTEEQEQWIYKITTEYTKEDKQRVQAAYHQRSSSSCDVHLIS